MQAAFISNCIGAYRCTEQSRKILRVSFSPGLSFVKPRHPLFALGKVSGTRYGPLHYLYSQHSPADPRCHQYIVCQQDTEDLNMDYGGSPLPEDAGDSIVRDKLRQQADEISTELLGHIKKTLSAAVTNGVTIVEAAKGLMEDADKEGLAGLMHRVSGFRANLEGYIREIDPTAFRAKTTDTGASETVELSGIGPNSLSSLFVQSV